jgi:WD domain, G-beta repeat
VSPEAEKVIRVWEVESGVLEKEISLTGAGEGFEGAMSALTFADEDHLLAGSYQSAFLALIDRRPGTTRSLLRAPVESVSFDQRGRVGFLAGQGVFRFELDGSASAPVPSHGEAGVVAFDPKGNVLASGGMDGVVRVGSASGSEPHLLFGHKGAVRGLGFSADGRWLVSASEDRTIRLWAVPDVSETPFQKRPYEAVLEVLRSKTNLRVVPDTRSPNGWKVEVGPFPGWKNVPAW